MLNRLYIIIGVLAILALGAAFIVPYLIPWGQYRQRMEVLASEALGTNVAIRGDIHFTLLPQPHLELSDVAIGPPKAPIAAVRSVDADFSLLDFLRDRYLMTSLVLDHPVLDVNIDDQGQITTGLVLPAGMSEAKVSVANARIEQGSVRVNDARSNRNLTIGGIRGELALGALRGPFAFQGSARLGQTQYSTHITSSALDAGGNAQVSVFAKPVDGAFSINLQGLLTTGVAPHLTGQFSYRKSPPTNAGAIATQGDLTFASKFDASASKIVFSGYTLQPDENRAGTRLTGHAVINLGKATDFDATVSGGVFALPPRDALAEQRPQPYELVRLLGGLPVAPLPAIPGKINIDIAELGLRAVALRNVRLQASSDTKDWTISRFSGTLPGNTNVTLAGKLTSASARPAFSGAFSIRSERLDALAALWRKPLPGNPLFDVPGSLAGKIVLSGRTLAFTDGKFTLDDTAHSIDGLIGFGDHPKLDVNARFSTLSGPDSTALEALLPDFLADTSARVTFPKGAFSFAADKASIFGLSGRGLALEGKWADGKLDLSTVSADDLGGAKLNLGLEAAGTMAAPALTVNGNISVGSANAPILGMAYAKLGVPNSVQAFLARSFPAALEVHLSGPGAQGAQTAMVSGTANAATINIAANFGAGITHALTSPFSATLNVAADDPAAFTQQLGLGDVSLMPGAGPMKLGVLVNGVPLKTLALKASVSNGADTLAYDGDLQLASTTGPKGRGAITVALSDSSVLADVAGAKGFFTPPVKGTAELSFSAPATFNLADISGHSGAIAFSGNLGLDRTGGANAVSGTLKLGAIDINSLVSIMAGPTALLTSEGKVWPDGPLALGAGPRATNGNISITTPQIQQDARVLASDAKFDLNWDATNIRLRGLSAKVGDGQIGLDLGLCCAGMDANKQVNGRLTLADTALEAVLPPASAKALQGTLKGSAQFTGTGDSIEAMLAGLGGNGSFSLSNFSIQKFDPHVFADIAAIENIVDLDAQALGAKVSTDLDKGPFKAPAISGSFTIAGGVVRSANLAAEASSARLFGGTNLDLADLGLAGSFALTPIGKVDDKGVVSDTTAQVTAHLAGTLPAPTRRLDIGTMVDGIKMRAYSLELARLEKLKAEDDARRKAAADAYAAKQAAAKQAAADAAAKKAADAAAARNAADGAAAQQGASNPDITNLGAPPADAGQNGQTGTSGANSPMDLGMPPLPTPF